MSETPGKYGTERPQIIVDSHTIINHLNAKSDVLIQFKDNELCVSALVLAELYSKKYDKKVLDNLFLHFTKLYIPYEIAVKAAALFKNTPELSLGECLDIELAQLHNIKYLSTNIELLKNRNRPDCVIPGV